jgi:hypothetical protein
VLFALLCAHSLRRGRPGQRRQCRALFDNLILLLGINLFGKSQIVKADGQGMAMVVQNNSETMSTSPHLPYITIDSPPPSPVQSINFLSADKAVEPETGGITGRASARRKRDATVAGKKKRKVEKSYDPAGEPADGTTLWDNGGLQLFNDDIAETVKPQAEDVDYDKFVDAVLAEECAVYQLTGSIFIVNGWERKTGMTTVSSVTTLVHCRLTLTGHKTMWYHLQRTRIGREMIIVCLCPEARTNGKQDCLHKRFIEDFGEEFPFEVELNWGMSACGDEWITLTLTLLNVDEHTEPILFSRQRCIDDKTFLNHFSVPTLRECRLLNSRVVVRHEGDDSGHGTWTCSKEPSTINCAHVVHCQNTLQQLVNCELASPTRPSVNPSGSSQYRGASLSVYLSKLNLM